MTQPPKPMPQLVQVVNPIQLATPSPSCDPNSHDFKDCNVYYLEDFDFSFNNSILKPSNVDSSSIYVVLVWAEWCGHCKRFMPAYKDFASMISSDSSRKNRFKICCIDGSGQGTRESERNLVKNLKNVVPEFQGFPTVVFFKAGKFVETYKGARTAEALFDYVKKF
jgi:thiol-disulfide isomerase/thioredoxin